MYNEKLANATECLRLSCRLHIKTFSTFHSVFVRKMLAIKQVEYQVNSFGMQYFFDFSLTHTPPPFFWGSEVFYPILFV